MNAVISLSVCAMKYAAIGNMASEICLYVRSLVPPSASIERGQRRQAGLIGRIDRGPGREHEAEGHQRRLSGQLHDADLRHRGSREQE